MIDFDKTKVYSACEIASILKVSDKVVYRIIRSGELKAKKVNGHYRIFAEWLRAYVNSSNTVKNTD